ncbi:MAG: riboflavin biosynthesis protein RibF [Lactobacillales bacterium]|jgi:riboflavin kinase/FMN adenylyltransferase|nr:riboflavin biosynthesis protein RibF [Lactobacillales bacterium]
MLTIHLHHPYLEEQIFKEDVVLVLGYFDGVHRGHQEVIQTGRKLADVRGVKLALMTFNQHPSIVFNKVNTEVLQPLNTPEKKACLMEKNGVDIYYIVDFTSSFASLKPQEFVEQYIVQLHAKAVVTGFDYTFGKKEVANVEKLPEYAKGRFDVITVPEFSEEQEKVSSTRIREKLDSGDIEGANELLGYRYETSGVVVHGDARGRLLGFPTANIEVPSFVRLPAIGVYVVRFFVNGHWYKGMASIGHNETFGEGRPKTLEVYILDFHEDIYGEAATVEWVHFIRGFVKFDGVDALVDQLKSDELITENFVIE